MKLYHRQHEKFHFNFCENWIAKLLFVVRSVGRSVGQSVGWLFDVCSVLMLFCSLLSMTLVFSICVWPEFLLEYMQHARFPPLWFHFRNFNQLDIPFSSGSYSISFRECTSFVVCYGDWIRWIRNDWVMESMKQIKHLRKSWNNVSSWLPLDCFNEIYSNIRIRRKSNEISNFVSIFRIQHVKLLQYHFSSFFSPKCSQEYKNDMDFHMTYLVQYSIWIAIAECIGAFHSGSLVELQTK